MDGPQTVLRAVGVAAADPRAGREQAFARHVIDFQPDAVGILEQHGIIAGGEAVLARFVNDFRADPDEEVMGLVDVAALACAKTVMMQPDGTLAKSLAGKFGSRGMDAKAGSPPTQ